MDRCMHTYMYVHLVKLRYQSSGLGCRLVDKGPGRISCTYVLFLDNVLASAFSSEEMPSR